MAYLAREDWFIAPYWWQQWEQSEWNGYTFRELVERAVLRLHRDLESGAVLEQADDLIQSLDPEGFSRTDLYTYLGLGQFRYRTPMGSTLYPQLQIHGPYDDTPDNVNGFVVAIPYFSVHLNHRAFLNWAVADPATFTLDLQGKQRLEVYIGKTVLHEVMHNHGFTHGDHPGFIDEDNPYFRTLPEIAERAFYNVYIDSLFGGQDFQLPLDDVTPPLRCGPIGGHAIPQPLVDHRDLFVVDELKRALNLR